MEMLYDHGDVVIDLPVICFDALLPGQRLQGSTTDPTFCEVSKLWLPAVTLLIDILMTDKYISC
jgi:hypothetical protein